MKCNSNNSVITQHSALQNASNNPLHYHYVTKYWCFANMKSTLNNFPRQDYLPDISHTVGQFSGISLTYVKSLDISGSL